MNTKSSLELNGDPLEWLLEPENPSVRFWALTDLLRKPESDPLVIEARCDLMAQELVQGIFADQQVEGHWGPDPTTPYTAQGAVGVLGLLHTLGVPPDERTMAGCNSLITYSQHSCGGFSLHKNQKGGIFPCTTAEHLPFLVYFGLAEDPRVRAAFAYLVDSLNGERPLKCSRYQGRDCLWGAIAILNGLCVLPPDMQTADTVRSLNRVANILFEHAYDFDGEHKRWLSFGVPRGWDLLSSVLALTSNGFSKDGRLIRFLQIILESQDLNGRFTCGSASRTWPLEKRGQPSKWVTLDVLRVLKSVEENRE